MKEKILVIGGAGFLGSHLADILSESGYEVILFDRYHSPWLQDGQEMVVGDIMDKQILQKAIKGVSYVYHLAGIAEIEESTNSPLRTIETNIIGSANIIEVCIAANVKRLVFASTVYVYSKQGSFYRVTKQAVELLLESYHETFGIEYTILRYGSLYGPRAQPWNGLKNYITQAIKNGKILYSGSGEERREYIHVRDAAKLSIDALADKFANKCLTLTGTQILTSKELMNMINEIMGGKIEIEFRPGDKDRNHYDTTPYRFTPREARKIVPNVFYDIGQGILDLVEEVYHENGGNNE